MTKGLGRGLGSLIPNINRSTYAEARGPVVEVPVDKILPNRYQPRQEFGESKLQELANSIRQHGVAQPIVIAPGSIAGEYELIAGERRWRAAQIAGLKTIPAIVRTVKENERFELSLIENIQRDDLNPLEIASAIYRLLSEFDLTQEEVAQRLGKSRSAVANLLRLLTLPEEIQEMLRRGVISEGHARALAGLEDVQRQKSLARKILSQRLTVREIEQIIQQAKKIHRPTKKSSPEPELQRAAEQIQQKLGTRVRITGRPHTGRIEIYYYTLSELERLIKILSRS